MGPISDVKFYRVDNILAQVGPVLLPLSFKIFFFLQFPFSFNLSSCVWRFLTLMMGVHCLSLFQGAAAIIFPIIKAEGVRQMFFPNMVPAYYKSPPIGGQL